MTSLHTIAARGFEQNAAEYERARPGYPPETAAFLIEQLDLRPGCTVVDVGAGTGKLARALVPSGARVIGVEPVAAMREQLQQVLPAVTVHDATADRLPFGEGSVDAIVCGQAFHWFATASVLSEFARVLRPGHRLGLVWNRRDTSVPWVRTFTELLRSYEGDRPDHCSGDWQRAFAGDVPFSPLENTSFPHEQTMTPDLLADRAASMSFVGALPEDARAEVLDAVRRLGQQQGASFVLPYRTEVYLTTRR